jgi:hypothetical protein
MCRRKGRFNGNALGPLPEMLRISTLPQGEGGVVFLLWVLVMRDWAACGNNGHERMIPGVGPIRGTCPGLLARLLNVTGRGSSSGRSVMKAVIDGSGHGVEIVLRDDARELQRLTIFEFEQFVQNLKKIAREARAETTRRARLAQLPMRG